MLFRSLTVLRRRLQARVRLTNNDRRYLIVVYRWFPSILQVLTIIRLETLIRWHRSGFRCYCRWKSGPSGGRPPIEAGLRALIRRMSMDNPLWGAPRIHGELLKLGFEVAQSSVAKYMVKRRGPPSQGWLTFLRNHAPDIAAMDFFVVPTIGFDLLYAFVIVRIDRRDLVWINVTKNPTAEWVARQIGGIDQLEELDEFATAVAILRATDGNAGAGKTTLARAIAYTAYGYVPKDTPFGEDMVEFDKTLLSELRAGPAAVLFDNGNNLTLRSNLLNLVLTSGRAHGRVLGLSEHRLNGARETICVESMSR